MVMGRAMAESAPLSPTRRGRLLKLLLRALVAASVGAVAFDLARRFDAADVSLRAPWIALSVLPAAVAVLVQVLAWQSLMRRLSGVALRLGDVFPVYLDAQMARYTPGKVGLLAVRVTAAPRLGVSARLMVVALFIELMSWAGVGILVGLTCVTLTSLVLPLRLGTWTEGEIDLRMLGAALAGAALLGLLMVCVVPRRRYPHWIQGVLALSDGDLDALVGQNEPLVPVALPLWHALHWGAWILSGATLCWGLGAGWAAAGFAGGVLCLAIVLGFLAIVAPAGAGVREVVISVGAAPVLGPSSALVLGLTARVVSLVADVACWAVVRLLALRGHRSSVSAPGEGR
jgi:hypothetical protein